MSRQLLMPKTWDDELAPYSAADVVPADEGNTWAVEERLLSCCLWGGPNDPGIDEAAEIVTPEDFDIPAHGAVFAACLECRRECGSVFPEEVADRLGKAAAADHNLAVELGALKPNVLAWLVEVRETMEPTGAHARVLATLVRDMRILRRLRATGSEIAHLGKRPTGPVTDVLSQCEQKLFDLSESATSGTLTLHSAASMMQAAAERVDQRQASGGALGGLSCGYRALDDLLGGLRPGQLIVVGARPGGGKTAIGLNIAARVATAGTPVLMFSVEMPQDQIADRLLSMGTGVPMSKLTRGQPLTDDEVSRVVRAAGPKWVGGAGFYCDDTSDQTAQRMAAVLRRAVRRHGVGLAVVDYLQLIKAENPRDNRTQQVGTAARRVKQMARECGVPVICLCQLNRQVEQRGADTRPKLSDLRESGEIEQHADMVLFMNRDPNLSNELRTWPFEVVVAKNRNGPVGDAPLMYQRATMTFESAAVGLGGAA